MLTRFIPKRRLIELSENILTEMEMGTLACFYEMPAKMDNFIIQQFDFFISKISPANQDSSPFQAS